MEFRRIRWSLAEIRLEAWVMSKPESTFSARRRALLSAVFIAVIYIDLATIVNLSDLGVRMPNTRLARTYNGMFRVFSGWSLYVHGYVAEIEVRPGGNPRARTEWREVDVQALFPMPRGASFRELRGPVQRDCDDVTRQLLAIYQRRDPEQRIGRLRLYRTSWPASPDGYFTFYDLRQMRLVCGG